jgi:hypothetical protein
MDSQLRAANKHLLAERILQRELGLDNRGIWDPNDDIDGYHSIE